MLSFILFQILVSNAQTSVVLSENFSKYASGTWKQGALKGPWIHEYHGYGSVGVQREASGNKVLFQKPKASVSLGETHASLVLSQKDYVEPVIKLKSKVVRQLRTPVPNPWETAWVLWNYLHDHRFYYFALKTNGWELGKVDNSKINPSGPECLWPAYKNCKYPGAQRFLKTGSFPRTQVGKWENIQVQQIKNKLVVFVNNQLVVQFTDFETPYMDGQVGLYNEDAYVQFDDVLVYQ